MELWIRSQDKEDLVKAYNFRILNESYIAINVETRGAILDYLVVGKYATKERALEVLDEIQNKIRTLLYLKPNEQLELNDIKAGKKFFEDLNGIDFITCDNNFEIIPITSNVIVYEMPKD